MIVGKPLRTLCLSITSSEKGNKCTGHTELCEISMVNCQTIDWSIGVDPCLNLETDPVIMTKPLSRGKERALRLTTSAVRHTVPLCSSFAD